MARTSESHAIEPLVRPRTVRETVLGALRAYIDTHGLRGGDPLPPESLLATQLGVGRNSVREAIKAMESLGILETRRGVGVFVKEFSFQPLLDNLAYGLQVSRRDIDELREIRRVLETGLIHRTIEMMDAADLAALRDTTERMHERATRGETFAAEDQQFHQLLFRCQGNRTLNALIDIFWLAFNKASRSQEAGARRPLDIWKDHHAIVEAIAARDVELARRRLDDHYHGLLQATEGGRSPG